MNENIAENVARVRAQIQKLARGREVKILAAVKAQPLENIRALVAAGVTCLGNNYAQEGEALMRDLPDPRIEWHFIGHIQSRKAKYLPAYHCVQSLDRLEVAATLQKLLAASGHSLSCLVEVNIGGEAQKSGIAPTELPAFLKALQAYPALKVDGLMAMPPPTEVVEARRPYFAKMRLIFSELQKDFPLHQLSMGTSDDFGIAVEEGSTLVRLGTVLLGKRS